MGTGTNNVGIMRNVMVYSSRKASESQQIKIKSKRKSKEYEEKLDGSYNKVDGRRELKQKHKK